MGNGIAFLKQIYLRKWKRASGEGRLNPLLTKRKMGKEVGRSDLALASSHRFI